MLRAHSTAAHTLTRALRAHRRTRKLRLDTLANGVRVAGGDLNGDGKVEVFVGGAVGSPGRAGAFDGANGKALIRAILLAEIRAATCGPDQTAKLKALAQPLLLLAARVSRDRGRCNFDPRPCGEPRNPSSSGGRA